MLRTLFKKGQAASNAAWNSKYYLPVLLIMASAATVTHTSFVCMCLFVFIAVIMLIFCDDMLSTVAPICFILQISVEYYRNYSQLVPYMMYAIVPFTLAFIFNLIYYRRPIKAGKLLYPLSAVSAALIIGGIGVVSMQDYLKPISVYYMVALGLGQLAFYVLFRTRLENKRDYDRIERLAQIVYAAGILFVVAIFSFYAQNFDEFTEKGGVLFYKPRNYLTTMFLMCMPMTCVLAKRSNLYLIGMALMYAAMIMTGSRSGLLFGSVLLVMCVIYIYITNKKSRRLYNRLFGCAALLAVAAAVVILPELYAARIKNAAAGDKTRIEFIKRGISNFLSHPIFGIGIGSTKDIGIFKAYVPGSLVFYHNAVIQVISSMGLAGVAAYGWMLIKRIKMLWQGRENAGICAFALAYIGILMMSMTNPGIFCPFPELGLLTLMFAMIEKEESI